MDLKQQVNDIEWSPHTSSVFAMVAEDGRLEIWDLKNNLEPRKTWWDKNDGVEDRTPKTVVRWSHDNPVIATGNTKGIVDVYWVAGLDHVQVSESDQIERLLNSIVKDEFGEG